MWDVLRKVNVKMKSTSEKRMTRRKARAGQHTDEDKMFIPLTEKVFAILRSMEENPRGALSVDEITNSVGLAKTTVHRLLYSIRQLGFVEQDIQGNYRYAERFYALSGHSIPYYSLISAAKPYLRMLGSKSGESPQVGVLENGVMLIIAAEQGRGAYRCSGMAGECCYAHSTAIGKAILANLTIAERGACLDLRGLPRLTAQTITDRSRLELELEKIRLQGWALNDGENIEGIVSIAAPVFDRDGRVAAAMSITGPRMRMHQSLEQHRVQVMQTAKKLSLVSSFVANGHSQGSGSEPKLPGSGSREQIVEIATSATQQKREPRRSRLDTANDTIKFLGHTV